MHHFIRTACATALLATGFAAHAGTVTFNSWQYAVGGNKGWNIAKIQHGNSTKDVAAAAFNLTLSGFADTRFNNLAFEAYCVELEQFISVPGTFQNYTIAAIETTYLASKAAALTRLISHASNTSLLANTGAGFKDDQSTALQLAIWNIVYDTDITLSTHLGANFSETTSIGYRNPIANFVGADALLGGPAASGYSLYVLQSATNQNQIIWLRNQVPEPTSLALVALALGGVGFVSRRRKA